MVILNHPHYLHNILLNLAQPGDRNALVVSSPRRLFLALGRNAHGVSGTQIDCNEETVKVFRHRCKIG